MYAMIILILGNETTPTTVGLSFLCDFIVLVGQISIAMLFGNLSLLVVELGR
jgi:hypothetical protein